MKLKEVDGIARTVRELMHVLSNSIETGPVVVYLRHMEGWRDALHAVVGEMKVSNRTPPRPSKTKKKCYRNVQQWINLNYKSCYSILMMWSMVMVVDVVTLNHNKWNVVNWMCWFLLSGPIRTTCVQVPIKGKGATCRGCTLAGRTGFSNAIHEVWHEKACFDKGIYT